MGGRMVNFREQIETFAPGIVSLTGGGGKTSLLFALAESLAGSGKRVVCTTTTRMLRPEPLDWLAVSVRDDPEPPPAPRRGALFAARPLAGEAGKVRGFDPGRIDNLDRRAEGAWILVEADGAAGRPLKAPAEHEPVIPSRTTVAIAVVGLGCMHRPFDTDTVFRMERVSTLTGLSVGDIVTPAAIARMAALPNGMFKNVPASARRFLFCNQADLPGAEAAGEELTREVRRCAPGFLHGAFVASLRTEGLRCRQFPTD